MGIDTMVPIPNNLYIFDKTTQKTVFASAINEYLKKECINIFMYLANLYTSFLCNLIYPTFTTLSVYIN